jgi:hypothetical protein
VAMASDEPAADGYVVRATPRGTEFRLDPARLGRLAGGAAAFNGLAVGCLGAPVIGLLTVSAPYLLGLGGPDEGWPGAAAAVATGVAVGAAVVWLARREAARNARRVRAAGDVALVVEPSGRVTFGGAEVVAAGAARAVRVEARDVREEGGVSTRYWVAVDTAGGGSADVRVVDSWPGFVAWADSLDSRPKAARYAARVAGALGVAVADDGARAGG